MSQISFTVSEQSRTFLVAFPVLAGVMALLAYQKQQLRNKENFYLWSELEDTHYHHCKGSFE